MWHSVAYSSKAAAFLQKLRPRVSEALLEAIEALADNPRPGGCLEENRVLSVERMGYLIGYEFYEKRSIILVVHIRRMNAAKILRTPR